MRGDALLLVVLAACGGDQTSTQPDASGQSPPASYTLFAPTGDTETFLIDDAGEVVHSWVSDTPPGLAVELLDDGDLIRAGMVPGGGFDGAGGNGGRLDRYSWDGTLEWSFVHPGQHHDFAVLPGGTIAFLSWEVVEDGRWSETVVEVDPATDEIIWRWRAWDHRDQIGLDRAGDEDLFHVNSIDYHPGRDQLLLSSRVYSELWVIDHTTGELLDRWGNPGTQAERELFLQHDAKWIPDGYPGAGNITVFDNGDPMLRPYSRVIELAPPPAFDVVWEYQDPDQLFARHISGAQRLPDGTTQICDGPAGRFFRVTPEGETTWSHVHGAATFRAERYTLDLEDQSQTQR